MISPVAHGSLLEAPNLGARRDRIMTELVAAAVVVAIGVVVLLVARGVERL